MKQHYGTLFFVRSRNRPVFKDVEDIVYVNAPKVGQAFLFGREGHGMDQCNTSTVQKIAKLDDCVLISTLNSMYMLYTRDV